MPQERRRRGEQFTYKKHRELCDLKKHIFDKRKMAKRIKI